MSSIIKVDTIQDQAGNNIINESSDTITIGASGDTVNIVGTITGFTSTGIDDNATSTAITINSSEQVEFTAGTALLPAITTTGDANTGMWFPAANTIAFSEGASEAMRIDSDGNIGIGTSSPSNTLHVVNSTSSGGLIQYDGQSNGEFGLKIQSNISGGNFENDFGGGGGLLDLFANSAATTGGDLLVARTQSATPVLLVKGNGNIGIGTASPSQKLDVVGSIEVSDGIYIGGTAAANKLDDYEEGTWTPGLSIASSGNSGTYTKVGNVVTAKFKVIPTASGTNVVITGFPFASNSDGEQQGGSREVESSGKFFFIRMAGSATEATIIRYDADVSITASMTFQGQITYLT